MPRLPHAQPEDLDLDREQITRAYRLLESMTLQDKAAAPAAYRLKHLARLSFHAV